MKVKTYILPTTIYILKTKKDILLTRTMILPTAMYML